MHYGKFMLVILSFFIGINLFFALIYMAIGVDHLGGLVATTLGEKFGEAFFFSAQTFTTVGYGRINPIGFLASTVAAIEALIGLLSFALATGLLYGRFARPRAYIHFSKNTLIAPFRDGRALMLRMVPYTKNHLTEVEAKVTLAIQVEVDGVRKNQFFTLPLDISKANTLSMNWTLVHVINENSPLYKLSYADLEAAKAELLVFVQGFDESFSSTVVTRSSYTWNEFVFGAKFVPMYNPSNDGSITVLHLNKLSDYETVALPDE
jgi:inward rectifier potassium channel